MNEDLFEFDRLNQENENHKMSCAVEFINFAKEFIDNYGEKLCDAEEIRCHIMNSIEFGANHAHEDSRHFTNLYARYIQLGLELYAGRPLVLKFVDNLDIREHEDRWTREHCLDPHGKTYSDFEDYINKNVELHYRTCELQRFIKNYSK